MNHQTENTVFVLIACKKPVEVEASMESGHRTIIHYAASLEDFLARINAGTPYRAVIVTQPCVSWLSDEVCKSLNSVLPASDVMVVSEKAVGDSISVIIDQEDLSHDNHDLKTELQDHKLALQIAQQRIDEVNTLLEAN